MSWHKRLFTKEMENSPFKLLTAVTFALGLASLALRSDWLPWKIVSQSEINQLQSQIDSLQADLAAARGPKRNGEWMHDPNYRTALEKKPMQGTQDASHGRETGGARAY